MLIRFNSPFKEHSYLCGATIVVGIRSELPRRIFLKLQCKNTDFLKKNTLELTELPLSHPFSNIISIRTSKNYLNFSIIILLNLKNFLNFHPSLKFSRSQFSFSRSQFRSEARKQKKTKKLYRYVSFPLLGYMFQGGLNLGTPVQ